MMRGGVSGSAVLLTALGVSIASSCAALPQDDVRTRIRTLAAHGELGEAEKVAREGNKPALVALGDVLVLRGKLAAADSAYRSAIAANVPDRADAIVALGELAERRGDHAEASRQARTVLQMFESSGQSTTADQAVGRAWILLANGNAQAPRSALSAFDAAANANPRDPEPLLRIGNLFLERYNAPEAKASFEAALKRSPDDARAVFGLARVEEFEGKSQAITSVRRAIGLNASLVPAQVMLARLHLEAEAYDSASFWARHAIGVDSAALEAWSVLGASAWLTGDSANFRTSRDAATRLQPRPSDFYTELAEAAVRQRRYTDAVRLARMAVQFDSTSVRALGVLGTNELRTGAIDEGKATLDRAFALDAYNVWQKNTLDLLDKMRGFKTIDKGRFRIVAPAKEADLLALYILPLLENAYDTLSVRYAFKPPTPVRLEFFDDHADFSVRTVGLAGLGALGVSFGSLLAMDTPSARDKGTFNWGSTAWHELTHAFTLGASEHRVPRWFSEGLSVLEERRAGRGWGSDVSAQFIAAYGGKLLRPVSRLNEGFLYPRNAAETPFSYALASLFCEMVEEQKGAKALNAMLAGWRSGYDTPTVFQRALGVTPAQLDAQFDAWMHNKFSAALQSIKPASATAEAGDKVEGPFVDAMRAAATLNEAKRRNEAIDALEKAQALFPQYTGPDSPTWFLARIYAELGDMNKALANLSKVTLHDETAWDANEMEAELRVKSGDVPGAMAAYERMLWMSPYDVSVHTRLADLAAARGVHALAIRERRAIIALDPADKLTARYDLAKALAESGDVASARRELMEVLEQAPSFEKAQLLLLELRGKTGSTGGSK